MENSNQGAPAQQIVWWGLPRQSPHGLMARLCLAMVATAGFFYVNILPALVDGLVTGRAYSTAEAGQIGSANIYGAAIGALLAVPLAGRLPWRWCCAALLCALMAVDFASALLTAPDWLVWIRGGHGVLGGLLVGIAYSIFARTHQPAQTFGVLLVVQYGLGGLGVMWLPNLVPVFGAEVLFWCLMLFSGVSLGLLALLPDYPVLEPLQARLQSRSGGIAWWPLLATLAALFLFQAGNNGPYAVIMGLAKSHGLALDYITRWLGIAAWLGVVGAVLVIVFSDRAGRLAPLTLAMVLTVFATWALLYAGHAGLFAAANCVVGITWAFVIAYLLGMAAEFDAEGRMAALAGFASKMGLASGSLVAAGMVGDGGAASSAYVAMLWVAVGALVLALLLAAGPALLLDRLRAAPAERERSPSVSVTQEAADGAAKAV